MNQGKRTYKNTLLDRSQIISAVACLLATCFTLILIKPWEPIVRFDSEVIRVHVDPERITVDGLYRLYNPLLIPMIQRIYYPTPTGGGLEPVDVLVVEQLPVNPEDDLQTLVPKVKGNRNYYRVTVPSRGMVEIRAFYSQRHSGSFGRYILTTTAGWGRPLRDAKFELMLDSLDLINSNYKLTDKGNGNWTFKRTDFMPAEDWLFTFMGGGSLI